MCVHVGRLMFAAGEMAVNIFLGATSVPHLKKTKRNKTEKKKKCFVASSVEKLSENLPSVLLDTANEEYCFPSFKLHEKNAGENLFFKMKGF